MQDKQFLSPNDIASELSVSASTVLRLIHEQRLPAIRVSQRIYRIPVAAFEKYKAGALESPSPARISPEVGKRPQIGAGEPLPEAPETTKVVARVRSA
ncbi:MAG TPA: helix-turn-helix domain-containing protein [Candidatus Limnocylindrales bacterium]